MAKRKRQSKQKDSGGRTAEVADQLEHVFLAGLGALANTQKAGSKAFDVISEVVFDLVVIDENLGDMTALDFTAKLISINPMINCALVSSLSPRDFHEASEGLGVLAHLPPRPDEKDGKNLLARLKAVKNAQKINSLSLSSA